MVQVLPYLPSFGEKLGTALGGLAGNVAQGFQQRAAQSRDQDILNQLLSQQNASPLQQIKSFSSLSPQAQQSLTPIFTHFLDMQKVQGVQQAEQAEKKQAEAQEHEDISELINEASDEVAKGRLGVGITKLNKLTSKGRESRAYFDELALGIEKRLANMVGKGALSVPRFEYLKKNLPSSNNTDATNRGKLRALAKEFKVDIQKGIAKESKLGSESQGKVVISPSGKRVVIPESELEAALAAGGKLE
jgi:hypothetical protein